jgi:hypothetical protein
VPVPHLQVHGRVQGDLDAIGQRAAQHVLLDHAVVGDRAPGDVVAQAGDGAVQPGQHLQVVLDRLWVKSVYWRPERSAL